MSTFSNSSSSTFLKRFFLVWFCFFCIMPLSAQNEDSPSLFDDDGSVIGVPSQKSAAVAENPIQNAVLEGIQLSSEPGATTDEKIITCYFIFKEQPTSYFYDSKLKEKKILFEFNDTELGLSPIPSQQEIPIQGFRIEESKVNVNAEVQGLLPEWHDVLRVTFFVDGIPQINVKDEYSIISFSFKWTTDPAKVAQYAVKRKEPKILIFSIGGAGLLAGGALAAWFIFGPEPPEPTIDTGLVTTDLPVHPTVQTRWWP